MKYLMLFLISLTAMFGIVAAQESHVIQVPVNDTRWGIVQPFEGIGPLPIPFEEKTSYIAVTYRTEEWAGTNSWATGLFTEEELEGFLVAWLEGASMEELEGQFGAEARMDRFMRSGSFLSWKMHTLHHASANPQSNNLQADKPQSDRGFYLQPLKLFKMGIIAAILGTTIFFMAITG